MEKWNGDLSATMEYRRETGTETCQLPWSTMESACGNLAALVESHAERSMGTWELPWSPFLDILMEYHEKSELWRNRHAEFVGYIRGSVASVFNG